MLRPNPTITNNVSWVVFFCTSHLDVAAFLRLAAISRSWVKPMGQLPQHIPAINVRKMPHFSNMLNTDFEGRKFVEKGLELSRFDYRLLPRLQCQSLRAPVIF